MARARWDRERERKEADAPPEEEPWPVDRPYYTIPVIHHGSDTVHVLRLYPAKGGRRDQFRVTVDGKEWKPAIGLTGVMEGIRKAMFRQN